MEGNNKQQTWNRKSNNKNRRQSEEKDRNAKRLIKNKQEITDKKTQKQPRQKPIEYQICPRDWELKSWNST